MATPRPRARGRYVLADLIGRGGMGEVFSGFVYGSHGFRKPVAIKRLVRELAADRTFVARLVDEAKVLVGIQHSNIVSVLDLAREGDDVFLVMEFVDGPSLHQLLKHRTEPLSFGIASFIIQSAAAGLQFAHEQRGGAIIHADISPGNLLLSTAGEVRVADFGIAQREGRAAVGEGKFAYMAPEQLRGEALTRRCDVFALGIVLYELLTGAHPFGLRITLPERLARSHDTIVPPRSLVPAIPVGLEAACLRALAEDPRDRFATMAELTDALVDQRYANGWREGANELALAIRAMPPITGRERPNTLVVDRPGAPDKDHPVTITTGSLIGAGSPPDADDDEPAADEDTELTSMLELPAHELPGAAPQRDPFRTENLRQPSEPAVRVVEAFVPPPPPLPPPQQPVPPPPDVPPLPAPPLAAPSGTGSRGRVIAILAAAAVAGIALAVVVPMTCTSSSTSATEPALAVAPPPPHDARPMMTLDLEPPAIVATVELDAPGAPPPPPPIDAAPPPIDAPLHHETHVIKQPPPPPPPPPRPQAGWLNVTTADGAWAKATLRAETFDIPGANFKLAAGTNHVTVKDGTTKRTCDVEFKPGSQTLTVSMKSGACIVR